MATPGARTIADLAAFLKLPPQRLVKTLIVDGSEPGSVAALVIRGDHELNAVKAQKLPGVASPLRMASAESVLAATGTTPGYVGLVGLKCRIYADHSALALADFVCGANEKDAHLTGVNWERDVTGAIAADLRNVVEGDASPTGKGTLRITRGIEVGHVFQLGCKYSKPMKAVVLDESGKESELLMGCYGIGVTRIVAAAIEQNHDERGIIWPAPIAPFQVVLVPINMHKSARVREVTDRLYEELTAAGIEVLYDDRDARPGVKFADAELLGIPHRLVVGERGIDAGKLEYRRPPRHREHRVPARRRAALHARAGQGLGCSATSWHACARWGCWPPRACCCSWRPPARAPTNSATRSWKACCARRSRRRSASPTSTTRRCGTR